MAIGKEGRVRSVGVTVTDSLRSRRIPYYVVRYSEIYVPSIQSRLAISIETQLKELPGHYCMSRVQALLALQDLDADVKRKIFTLVFPKRADIAAALQRQHTAVPELAHVDKIIIDFAHDGHLPIELTGLRRSDRKWAHLRCEFLGLEHQSYNGANGRILVVFKGRAWEFTANKKAGVFRWTKPTHDECEICGEMLWYPEGWYDDICDYCR